MSWLIPLPMIVIARFRVIPRSCCEIREVSKGDGQVSYRYADYTQERTLLVPIQDLTVSMKRDPSTIYRRYVLEIAGPDIHVRQYEGGKWSEQKMQDVHDSLSTS